MAAQDIRALPKLEGTVHVNMALIIKFMANYFFNPDEFLDQIFDFMIRDFSKFALQLYSKTSSTDAQMALCLKIIRQPVKDPERFDRIWSKYVEPLNNAYEMNP